MKKLLLIGLALVQLLPANNAIPEGITIEKKSSEIGSIRSVWVEQNGDTLHIAGDATQRRHNHKYHIDITLIDSDSIIIAQEYSHIWGLGHRQNTRNRRGRFSTDFTSTDFKGTVELAYHKCSHEGLYREIEVGHGTDEVTERRRE